ncbi:flagellar hook-length control protein FliK [Vibrio diazotrophicus]|uniref:flagellar hook-length control protein FliK n=1 Tax=Vibrio diazotrophicus TaxID=685 RepID=UPI000C9DF82F|nr:flagellar hook-length control protein FliK [Vibrio diazotrophicus]PNH94247.1 hypothetical protein C1O24_17505 [Vibrio diazotrophicus]
MINGLSHSSTDTTTLAEGSVLNAKQGFSDSLPSGTMAQSFAALLSGTESETLEFELGVSATEAESGDTIELVSTLADDATAEMSDDLTAAPVATTHLANVAKDPSVSVSSSAKDSLVSAVSNVVSTSASLTTAQTATNQLATSSLVTQNVVDSRLIDVVAVKEHTVSTDALLNNHSQSTRSELNANLRFRAVMDKSLSAQELGERLSATIADKVSVQINAKTPTATIRLDPPDLGKIELVVKLDNDKLHIQINASSNTTRESIQMTSDRLRAELVEQNFLNVDVSVSGDQQQNAEQDYFVSSDEFMVVDNSAGLDLDTVQDIDNNELARA